MITFIILGALAAQFVFNIVAILYIIGLASGQFTIRTRAEQNPFAGRGLPLTPQEVDAMAEAVRARPAAVATKAQPSTAGIRVLASYLVLGFWNLGFAL